MTEFTYQEWHFLWKAVENRASEYWALVERFQTSDKNGDDDTNLWLHFLELAEEQTQLLDKIETVANEHFPITEETLFPARSIEVLAGQDKNETLLACPYCQSEDTVYHMQWESKTCQTCKKMINKNLWVNLENLTLD